MVGNEIDLGSTGEWIGDDAISLSELERLIPILKQKYGSKAVVYFDAGVNNVEVRIITTKKRSQK